MGKGCVYLVFLWGGVKTSSITQHNKINSNNSTQRPQKLCKPCSTHVKYKLMFLKCFEECYKEIPESPGLNNRREEMGICDQRKIFDTPGSKIFLGLGISFLGLLSPGQRGGGEGGQLPIHSLK